MARSAGSAGLHSVPHAGETTGPQPILDAIRDLGAERSGSSTASPQFKTRHFLIIAHPIRELIAADVRVTVNSDDPPMFATTVTKEYAIAARLLGLDQAGVADLART